MTTIKQLLNTYFNLKSMSNSTAQDYTLSIDDHEITVDVGSVVGLKINGYLSSETARVLLELKAAVLGM